MKFKIPINFDITSFLLSDNNHFIKNNTNLVKQIIKYSIEDPFNSKMYNVVYDTPNINYNISSNPLVYIYNTHDTENYLDGLGVREASQLMKEELEKLNIPTLIEDRRVTPYLDLSYSTFFQAYAISRKYVEEVLDIYPEIKIVIDLHRDSIPREASYVKIGDIYYAKVLFVQGVRYDNYKDNLALVNKICDKLKEKYPGISKGVMIKDKSYQHDSYNQDLSKGAFLLELGSNNNTFEEITNTIEVLSKIIKEIIYEEKSI